MTADGSVEGHKSNKADPAPAPAPAPKEPPINTVESAEPPKPTLGRGGRGRRHSGFRKRVTGSSVLLKPTN